MATQNENNSSSTEVPSTEVPVEVQVNTENGVDPQALTLATTFMEKVGGLARLTKRRGDLSYLYICTMGSWASPEVLADVSLQRHFKQILFALAHSLHVVRVVGEGRILLWNRYRDNSGNEIEDRRQEYDRNQEDRGQGDRGQGQGDRRGGDRGDRRGGDRGDRRGGDRGDRRGGDRGDRRGGDGPSSTRSDRPSRYQDGGDGDRRSRRASG